LKAVAIAYHKLLLFAPEYSLINIDCVSISR
jgi:hypothetical protein